MIGYAHVLGSKTDEVTLLPKISNDLCSYCTGTGKCAGCKGRGFLANKQWCDQCGGSAHCAGCNGYGRTASKLSRRDFEPIEKQALIDEEGEAGNAHRLNTEGTHYQNFDPVDILFMMPKGL